jgi:hypothetical protein
LVENLSGKIKLSVFLSCSWQNFCGYFKMNKIFKMNKKESRHLQRGMLFLIKFYSCIIPSFIFYTMVIFTKRICFINSPTLTPFEEPLPVFLSTFPSSFLNGCLLLEPALLMALQESWEVIHYHFHQHPEKPYSCHILMFHLFWHGIIECMLHRL